MIEIGALVALGAALLVWGLLAQPQKSPRPIRTRREAYASIADEHGYRDLSAAELDAILKPYREAATALGRKAKQAERLSDQVYNDGASLSAVMAQISPWVMEAKNAQAEFSMMSDRIFVSTDGGWNKIERVVDRIDNAAYDIIAIHDDLQLADPIEDELTP